MPTINAAYTSHYDNVKSFNRVYSPPFTAYTTWSQAFDLAGGAGTGSDPAIYMTAFKFPAPWIGTAYVAFSYNAAGFRFPSVSVPQGATIDSATLTTKKNASGFGSPTIKIYADNVDSAPAWGTSSRVKTISKTAASTNMDISGAVFDEVAQDVQAIVQEIVDRGGWSADNAMRFGFFPKAASLSNFYGFAIGGINASDTDYGAPFLDITYTEGGGGGGGDDDFWVSF